MSEAIILEAQKVRPNLYDEVRVGDVTEVFRAEAPLSMIVAADSYIYFGDLDPLFQSMEESLEDGGYVAFTLENVSDDSEKRWVMLDHSIRYWLRLVSSDFSHLLAVWKNLNQIGDGNSPPLDASHIGRNMFTIWDRSTICI